MKKINYSLTIFVYITMIKEVLFVYIDNDFDICLSG